MIGDKLSPITIAEKLSRSEMGNPWHACRTWHASQATENESTVKRQQKSHRPTYDPFIIKFLYRTSEGLKTFFFLLFTDISGKNRIPEDVKTFILLFTDIYVVDWHAENFGH